MQGIVWFALAFLSGALPFSVWVGEWGLRTDIRQYGDSNPGATNVLRAGSKGWFLLALLLDITKGALPVGLARYVFGLDGWLMAAVALAPSLGHAFSPFLRGRGGKAAAVSLGAWIGLTLWRMSAPAVVLLSAWSLLIKPSGWAVMATMASLAVYAALMGYDAIVWAVLIGQTILLAWKYREDLSAPPHRRS